MIADAADAAALGRLAADTRVVLSTAGPFALHGDALVDACVAARTHYVDITGETPWVRRIVDRHHARAARDGTRIVPCCGFDSVPSDLGAWCAAHALLRDHGEACVEVKACFSLRGGLNGGTVASALAMYEAGDRVAFEDPFLLVPDAQPARDTDRHADPRGPRLDRDFDAWVAPFFMGPVNSRVVRRSAALLRAAGDPAYAAGFAYSERLRTGRGAAGALAALVASLGTAAAGLALRAPAARAIARRLLPAPGLGPTERAMDEGSFRCEVMARGERGTRVRGRIVARGDPGNRATTVFACESALALALQADRLPGAAGRGGVLTPATAFGEVLVDRLHRAGIVLEPQPTSRDLRHTVGLPLP